MFPRIQYPLPSARSRSRSTVRTHLSTPGYQGGRLPKLSGHSTGTNRNRSIPNRSNTDPRLNEYPSRSSTSNRNQAAKRRVRSLGQQNQNTKRYPTSSRKRSVEETTYVLTNRHVTNQSNQRKSAKNRQLKTDTSSLSALESMNEGVVRKSQFVKVVPDDRIVKRRYEFEGTIGEGNFSVVVRCYNRKDDGLWALKIIDKVNLKQKTYYIENEADLLLRCIHPNIIKLKEAYQTPDQYFLIMELLENGDLFDEIKRAGHFDEPTTAKFVGDVASALRYLHNHNIAHRDIKPENLLLTSNFRIKLGDFGLACQVRGPLYRVCGTPTYVAPEVLAETGYGLEADCWSLGVIMYILLCGFAPFRHQDRNELFRLIQSGRFQYEGPKWIRVSKGAKQLVSSLLLVDPSRRCLARHVLKNPWFKQMLGQMREE